MLMLKDGYKLLDRTDKSSVKRCKQCERLLSINNFNCNIKYYVRTNGERVAYKYTKNICKECSNEYGSMWFKKKNGIIV